MKIVRGLRNLDIKPVNPAVALGNFDGVHAGHQFILEKVIKRARAIGGTSVVYTFEPHPLKIVAPHKDISLLTVFKKKMELIASFGVDMTICADFNRNFARMHPRDFAKKLSDGLQMDTVFVGLDYSFGQGATGTIEYLAKMGDELGFNVDPVDTVLVAGERVSSSSIRELLQRGEVTEAAKRLNRHYSIAGKVVTGYQRGRAIGYPTANLDTPYEVIPAVGVYAVFVKVADEKPATAVVNIGYNPTFDRNDLVVEAHLLDRNDDIYGAEVEIYFVQRIRDEIRFGSVEELKERIGQDVVAAKSILSKESGALLFS